jgi:ABC-type dipeptide/oligopeptide/nickel transport system permease component
MKLRDYIIRRLLLLIPVLLGLSVIVFALGHVGNRDPAALYITERMTNQQIEQVYLKYGFDKPVYVQYWNWLAGALAGDLGYSKTAHLEVTDAIATFFPATFELTTVSIFFAVVIAIPLGILSAKRRNEPADHASRIFALVGVSIPIFWLAVILIFIFGFSLGWFPLSGRYDDKEGYFFQVRALTHLYTLDSALAGNWLAFVDAVSHIVLPSVALSYASTAYITRIMRSSMLEVLNAEYIKTARAKGLSEKVVVNKHAVRNALIPTTTVVGLSYGGLLGGAVLTETIFRWPGVGTWSVNAALNNDLAGVLGFTLLVAVIYVLVNLIVDITYAYLDPRIRLD